MDILGGDIALGGDIKNVVRREDMIWPEVILMRDIHGEASVTNIEVLGEEDRDTYQELERMRTRYGKRFVRVFGRSVTTLPWQPPAGIPRWDDMVEVTIRQRRPRAPNPAYVQSEAERRERALAHQGKADPRPPAPEDDEDDGPHPEDEDDDDDSEDAIAAKAVSSRRRSKVAQLPPTLET